VVSIRTAVHNGTLLRDHGVTPACAHCMAQVVTTAPDSTTPLSTTLPAGYDAADLAAAYHLPAAGTGATGTIAIIDAGAYPTLESDVNAYRAQNGLPACTTASGCPKITDQHGGPALPPPTSILDQLFTEEVGVETTLDMDMASAACPSCKLVELQVPIGDALSGTQAQMDAAMGDFGDAVNTAASLGATAVSMSYQFPSDTNVEFGAAGRALFHPGVAVLASSGDGGYEGNTHTGWPQNLPWVTSVSANCGGHRAASDVSAVADPNTGVAVYDTYSPFSGVPLNWIVGGGTSASSPFIAGLYARGGHTSQVLGPNTLYTAPAGAFADVTLGQNAPAHVCPTATPALCSAGKGWDAPTGVGVPNGLAGF
jgi:hypothetical protein